MENSEINKFKKMLPQEILDRGVYLGVIGIEELAWNWQDALLVIEYLYRKRFFILGGDVYIQKPNGIRPTGDNWYAVKSGYLATLDEIENSRAKSLEFIEKYIERKEENFLFTIVPLT